MEQKQAILAVGAEINLPVELTNSHWQLMIKLLRALRPFEEATKEASFGDRCIYWYSHSSSQCYCSSAGRL